MTAQNQATSKSAQTLIGLAALVAVSGGANAIACSAGAIISPPAIEVRIRDNSVRNRFQKLAAMWKRDVALTSSAQKMIGLPSYQQIIGLGPAALPYILEDLRESPAHWFWALASISGANPVDEDDAGDFQAMRAAWLSWGESRGLISA